MDRKNFLTFMASFDLGCKKLKKLFEYFDEDDFDFKIVYNKKFVEIIGDDISKIQYNANENYLEKFKDELFSKGVGLISCEDKEYSKRLLNIEDYPFFLFYKGDISLLCKKSLAVVGTRMPSAYGKVVTERFCGEIAENGIVVVSGLAYGVDSIAHRKTMEVGGKTIAVLGGGFDKIYPSEHTNLASQIASEGLLLTEYSPSAKSMKYFFPQRNRIVAGLCQGVLITEAGEKSGTMITKDFALDNGISVYAVPGNITSDKSGGTNNIIFHGHGQCVINPKNILEDYGINSKTKKKVIQLKFEEQQIVDILAKGEQTSDYISEKANLPPHILGGLLVSLEIKNIIKKGAGGYYCLT